MTSQIGVTSGASADTASVGARMGVANVLSDHFALGVTLHYTGLFDRNGESLHSLVYTGDLVFFGDHAGFRLSLGLLGGGGPSGPGAAYGLGGGQIFGHVGPVRIYGGAYTTVMVVLGRKTVDSTAIQGSLGIEFMLFEEPWLRVGLSAELQGGRRRFGGTDALDTSDHFIGALGNLTVYLGEGDAS